MALTKYNYNSFDVTPVASTTMAFNSGANGLTTKAASSMVLIKTLTASSDSTLSFVDGASDVVLDNTYPIYLFKFINIHPSNDSKNFSFQGSTDTGSSYGVTMSSTAFQTFHDEADTQTNLSYRTGTDIAQGTGYPALTQESSSDNDHGVCGYLYLFNPSSTTFVKHWMCRLSSVLNINYANEFYSGGYFNTTSAIDAIQFKFTANNIDTGSIKLYGIKDS
jgi:hypothetical protein